MKIVTVVGARPQFVKAAAVSRLFRLSGWADEVLVHTGQHYDQRMSDVFFDELEIPAPDFHLGVGSGAHGAQTGRMLAAIEDVLQKQDCDCLLVYGDTNSTLAGALAAAKMHIPVVHVEAGLRSFNRRMPEEINRVVCDHVSDLLLAPTETAVNNLREEGISDERVKLVGDVMYDAALHGARLAEQHSRILDQCELSSKQYILATIHRAENVDDPARLREILNGICELAESSAVVLPLHPRTRQSIEKHKLLLSKPSHLNCVDPVGYLDMLMLERNAKLIVTDSGGVQKEAYFARVPCLTLREETEWTELVALGWNRLVTSGDLPSLARIAEDWTNASNHRETPADLYGGGHAAERICNELQRYQTPC